jgi:hypothetical protein
LAVILNLGGTKRAFRTVSEVEEEPESHNVASFAEQEDIQYTPKYTQRGPLEGSSPTNTAEEKQKVRKLETEWRRWKQDTHTTQSFLE